VEGILEPGTRTLLSVELAGDIADVWLGRLASHRLPLENFRKYIFGGLIVIGLILAFQALQKGR